MAADTVDTRPLMISTVVQDGSAFSYGVTIGGTAIPAGDPVQLFPKRYNKADTITSVDLSSFFILTATDTANTQRLAKGKKVLITELIQEASQKFPSESNGPKTIHLHCDPACAQALQGMNISFDSYQIVWDTALWVWSWSILTVGPRSFVNISGLAALINTNPEVALGIAGAGTLSLWGLGLAGGALLNRRRKEDAPTPEAPKEDAPTPEAPVRDDADPGDVLPQAQTDALNQIDGLLSNILEIRDMPPTRKTKWWDIEVTIEYKWQGIIMGATSAGNYYLLRDNAPLRADGSWGTAEDDDVPDLDIDTVRTALQTINAWFEWVEMSIAASAVSAQLDDHDGATAETKKTIEQICDLLGGLGHYWELPFRVGDHNARITGLSHGEGENQVLITIGVSSRWEIGIRMNDTPYFDNTFVPFDEARETLEQIFRREAAYDEAWAPSGWPEATL